MGCFNTNGLRYFAAIRFGDIFLGAEWNASPSPNRSNPNQHMSITKLFLSFHFDFFI